MTHAALIAVHAAHAAAAKSREKVLDAFRTEGATAPERARSLAELALPNDDKAFATFFSVGVIRGVDSRGRATVPGDAVSRTVGYYLDEPTYIAHRDSHGKRPQTRAVIITLAVVMVFLALGLVFVLARST